MSSVGVIVSDVVALPIPVAGALRLALVIGGVIVAIVAGMVNGALSVAVNPTLPDSPLGCASTTTFQPV